MVTPALLVLSNFLRLFFETTDEVSVDVSLANVSVASDGAEGLLLGVVAATAVVWLLPQSSLKKSYSDKDPRLLEPEPPDDDGDRSTVVVL